MNKIIALFIVFFCMFFYKAFAIEDINSVLNDIKNQNNITNIGLKILNANKIENRMIFAYSKEDKLIKGEPGLTQRQIVLYDKLIKYASDENEIAAILAREIAKSNESYSGKLRGIVSSAQIKAAPKKFELLFDKRAIDLMVNAGYNPIAFITYTNKAYPQKRYDLFSSHNLTSKRLAYIYEYIYTKYPYYLKNNEYLFSDAYQNFLLTSIENRKKFQHKIESGSKEIIKYE